MNNDKLEKLILPEQKSGRIERLVKAKEILKSEFIGLDEIIDEIIKDISPWYITPEIVERPVVISLFGMSGTGKTSVVKRIVELLGLSGKSIFFDCGEESNESGSMGIIDKITEAFGTVEDSILSEESLKESVFVFDEFQYARTITESRGEIIKPTLRPIWSIIDSGIVSINEYRYEVSHFMSFLDDFSVFAQEHGEIKLIDGEIRNRDDVRTILLSIGLFQYDRDIKQLLRGEDKSSGPKPLPSSNKDDDEEEDVLSPLKILDRICMKIIVKKLNSISPNYGFEKIEELDSAKTIGEFYEILRRLRTIISAPKKLDCSRSLVFIIGNLDEAFHVQSDLSPDIDADTFYYQTKSVSISDIKEALKSRFRAEQIARFGNNLIKYPTLKKEHFKKIISKELNRIVDRFYELEGIKVIPSKGIEDLLYSEGVFPSQGVRPVFTTIGAFFTPLLSNIIIGKDKNKVVEIKLENEDTEILNFNKKEIPVLIVYSKEKEIQERVVIPLQLGPLRDPGRRVTRYCNAVHEVGHAIVSLYESGEYPVNIVAVSSGDGGFCDTYNKKKEGEIDTKEDINSEVRVLLAGYYAERLIFKDENRCLMGSSSDIDSAWECLSNVVYKVGYFEPICFSNHKVDQQPSGIPTGLSDKLGKKDIQSFLRDRFDNLIKDTITILEAEKELLKQVSLELGEKGSMTGERFEEFVKKYGNLITEDYIKNRRKYKSGDWYLNVLKNI